MVLPLEGPVVIAYHNYFGYAGIDLYIFLNVGSSRVITVKILVQELQSSVLEWAYKPPKHTSLSVI